MTLAHPRIGVDVDAVLVDIVPVWCDLYNEEWDDTLVPEEITDWDMTRFVKPECGKQIYAYLSRPELYERAAPVEGAQEGVQALRDLGLDLVLLTTSFDGQGDPKRDWLRRHDFLPPAVEDPLARELCQFSQKHLLPLSLLIDDYIGNLEPLSANVSGILFPAPYNVALASNGRFPRARHWPDVVNMVKRLVAPIQRSRAVSR